MRSWGRRRVCRLRVGPGRRVLRLEGGLNIAWLAPQTQHDQARRGDPAGARPPPRRRPAHGAGDDRQTPAGPLPLRSSAPPACRSPRAGTASPGRKASGAHPRGHSKSSARSSPARASSTTRASITSCPLPGWRGQAAEAQLPPRAQQDPRLRRRDRTQIGRDGGGDLRLVGSQFFSRSDALRADLGRAPGGRLRRRRQAALRPSGQPLVCGRSSTATWRRRRASSRPASSSTSAAWVAARPTSTLSRPRLLLRFSRGSPTRFSAATRRATKPAPSRRCPTRSSRRPRRLGSEAEVAWRLPRAPGIDRLIVSPVHTERDQQTLRLALLAGVQHRPKRSS